MDPSSLKDFRAIGKVVAAHGLQGTLKVESWSDFAQRFFALKWVYLKVKGGELSRHKVKDVRLGSRYVLLKLEGLTRREETEDFREAELLIPEAESWPLPPNRFYISDLIGLEAFGTDGTVLGQVSDVLTGGAQDILSVDGPYGEMMIPLVDEWVRDIDIASGKVHINNWQSLVNPEECKDAD